MLEMRKIEARDRKNLRQYCEEREYASSAFASAEECKAFALQDFDNAFDTLLTRADVFGQLVTVNDKIEGFVLGQTGQIESITKDSQLQVVDLSAKAQPIFNLLVDKCVEIAREAKDDYVVYHTYESQAREKRWAEAKGLKAELFRTFMTVSPEDKFESHPDYELRRAEEHEMLFIMNIVTDHSPAYVPAHRPVNKMNIQAGFVNSYTTLRATDKKKVPLVLCHKPTGDLVGYMILMPEKMFRGRGSLAMYLYDIAVGERGEGRGLSRWMALGSKDLMAKMGGGFLFGDVSPENKLALSATLALGSRIDSRRWGMKVA